MYFGPYIPTVSLAQRSSCEHCEETYSPKVRHRYYTYLLYSERFAKPDDGKISALGHKKYLSR